MNLTRITVITAAGTVVAWAAKAVAIGLAGGLGESPFEGPLFLVGLFLCVTACGSLAVDLVRSDQWWARVGAVVASVVAVVAAVVVLGVVIDAAASSNHWVWSELNLWVLSLCILAVAAWRSERFAALR